ncbi:MAG: hypothetical protein JRD94_12210, partial [Deltaproteobacteria bacterium]|nr:hypothetical protein [Deltaproteobacteria bacterium]
LGLAPAFEMLREEHSDGGKTMPVRKPTPPPPPPESRKPPPTPIYQDDDDFEPELAPMLEGPATLLAPAATSPGMAAWIQGLLLLTVLAGLGVFGWQLWVRSNPATEAAAETPLAAHSEVEGNKGPITGPVNGLEPVKRHEAKRTEAPTGAEPSAAPKAPIVDEPAQAAAEEPPPQKPAEAKQPPPPKPAKPEATATKSKALSVPTQNLPRDPAKASDVLVHRALPMIRSGNRGVRGVVHRQKGWCSRRQVGQESRAKEVAPGGVSHPVRRRAAAGGRYRRSPQSVA